MSKPAGEAAALVCVSRGDPAPAMSWKIHGTNVPLAGGEVTGDWRTFFFFFLSLIIFISRYYCVVIVFGVRCSSVVRAFAHGAMGHWIDPSWGASIE